MLLRAYKLGYLLIWALCSFEHISSTAQWNGRPYATGSATPQLQANQRNTTVKTDVRLTESYLPAVMQAIAYYVELLQYEPLHSTTAEPPFNIPTSPATYPNKPSSSTVWPPAHQPVTWWSPPSTTTQRPVTWWSPPSTTTQRPGIWWYPPSTTTTHKPWWSTQSDHDEDHFVPSTVATTTRRPSVSTSTPSWWHQETTPFHKPGNYAPERPSNQFFDDNKIDSKPTKPKNKPQFGDLSLLSISNFPHFEHFVKPKSIGKKTESGSQYPLLHQYPADLLQDIENEPYELAKRTDQQIVNEFRRIYDDFFSRVRIYSPITGKKRVPPTRPYVLFLIIYDLYKREAKRLALQEFTGYSPEMLARLHETSKHSAPRQLYTLMYELLAQKQIVATDVVTRTSEIMTDLGNPNSVTSKALHVLPTLKFEF